MVRNSEITVGAAEMGAEVYRRRCGLHNAPISGGPSWYCRCLCCAQSDPEFREISAGRQAATLAAKLIADA